MFPARAKELIIGSRGTHIDKLALSEVGNWNPVRN